MVEHFLPYRWLNTVSAFEQTDVGDALATENVYDEWRGFHACGSMPTPWHHACSNFGCVVLAHRTIAWQPVVEDAEVSCVK